MSLAFAIGLPPLPPLETPAGAPGLGFLIAFEDPAAETGWSAGVVEAIEEGCEGREFTVKTRNGPLQVSRGMVFYWWPLPLRPHPLTPSPKGEGEIERSKAPLL